MRRWMCELVLLISPVLQRNEDTLVVISSHDPDAGARELGRQLIISPCRYALLRAIYNKGGHRGMV